MKVKSKALEVNLADYHVDVSIDAKYTPLQEVMSQYYGLLEGLNTFLKELSHPYKNWRFIVNEARKYSLEYFHLVKKHPAGPEAASLFVGILLNALSAAKTDEIKADAVDNLLLYLQKIIKDSGVDFKNFQPVVDHGFDCIRNLPANLFPAQPEKVLCQLCLGRDVLRVKPKGAVLAVCAFGEPVLL